MAKKTFKDKEESFKKKNGIASNENKEYVPEKTKREKALELLEKNGFKISIKDDVLYCECEDEEEYEQYKSLLVEHFGHNGKVPFSFGGTIKVIREKIATESDE